MDSPVTQAIASTIATTSVVSLPSTSAPIINHPAAVQTQENPPTTACVITATMHSSIPNPASALQDKINYPILDVPAASSKSDSFVLAASAHANPNNIHALQEQIAELEGQLKNMQVMLKNSDSQCTALKMALQSQPSSLRSPTNSVPTITRVENVSTSMFHQPFSRSPIVTGFQAGLLDCSQREPYSRIVIQPPMSVSTSSFNSELPMYTQIQPSQLRSTQNAVSQQQLTTNGAYTLVPRKVQNLPTFSGHPDDWPMFYTSFVQSTAAYGYSNLENNQRLQQCLQGEARETVKSLLIHPDNVNSIVEELRFRFGRPEQLISSQLSQVKEIPPVNESNLSRLIPFATKTRNLSVFLQSVNGQHHLTNPSLLKELVSKLPMSRKLEWARYSSQIYPYPTVIHFSDWLCEVARLICSIQDIEEKEPKRRLPVLHAAEPRRITLVCPICQGHHKVSDCSDFLRATVQERWSNVKRHRLCFTCLKRGHMTRDCHVKIFCSTNGCSRRHHKLLHEVSAEKINQQQDPAKDVNIETGQNHSGSTLLAKEGFDVDNKFLFRIVPVTLHGPNKSVDTYALLDEGSSISMLDASLISELGLQGNHRQLNIQWVAGRQAQEPTVVVNLSVSGKGMSKKHPLKNVYGVSNLKLPMQSLGTGDLIQFRSRLRGATPQLYADAEPKLLIGLDHCHLGLATNFEYLRKGGPYAARTKLGWVVFGPTTADIRTIPSCFLTHADNDLKLHQLVADYFRTENFGVSVAPPVESKEDVRARDILQSTTRKVGDRFEVGLLWKSDDFELPDSFSMALRRLIGVERRMKQNEDFATAYKCIIEGYIEKNYVRKLRPVEVANTGPRTWYLPHFGVVNPNKPRKLRLVFDAAAEVKGISLNSYLLNGPQQYQSLPSVLFHFREGAVAVCGDIRDMFHQVLIRPEDRCAQRFLWRDGDDSRPPDIYEMLVMTFGAACSPCAAHYVKIRNAAEHADGRNLRAIQAISEFHYVDDLVDSFNSAAQAVEVVAEVRRIHKAAGFELRGFRSNSLAVLNALEPDKPLEPPDEGCLLQAEKVLGMYWQPANDDFKYKLQFHRVDKDVIAGKGRPTKRQLLSVIMSVFDPLGFLSPFVVIAKILMREL